MTTTIQRFIECIHGRDYRVEVTQVTFERWRAHVLNAHGGPTALMPFYATTADLAISKDNYIFGVVSVDAQGHESVPVLPMVGR